MKRAIIIGATSGIGKEVAQRLLSEGWQIGMRADASLLSKISGKCTGTDKNSVTGLTQEDSAGNWMRLSIN